MRALCAALCLLVVGPALAERPSGLQVFVFAEDGGGPLRGAIVRVGDRVRETNRDGTSLFDPGVGEHPVRVVPSPASGLAPADLGVIPVVPGELTEVIATLRHGQVPQISVETRALAEATADAATDAAGDAGPRGALHGRAVSETKRAPVRGARVFVKGRSETTTTDPDGRFTLRLPVGPQTLSVIHPDFSPGTADVQISEAAPAEVELALAPAALQLDAFVVNAPYIEGGLAQLSAERRGTSGVVDVIGAEQMAKTGDSNAAAALRRVTGLTLVGGKYVYVRGMGERYASTLLNGTRLPSPEPERRVVPLDMFPTGILGSVVVQKTWSPDQPGAFGGGVVRLRTRGTPEAPFTQVTLGTGFRPDTTFQTGLSSTGGSLDWLGIDDGTRALPGPVADILKGRLLSRTRDDFKALGQSFKRNWDASTRTVPPPMRVALAAGRPFSLWGKKMGVLGALSYRQNWLKRTVDRTTARVRTQGDEVVVEADDTQRIERLERTLSVSGLLELDAELAPGHRIWSTSLVLRTTDDITRLRTGFDGDQMTDIRVHRLEWVERMLIDQILRGQHDTPLGRVDWAYALSVASRDEPDRRSYRYDYEPPSEASGEPGGYRMYDRPEGNQRFFSAMGDLGHDAKLAWTVPLTEARRADAPDEPTRSIKLGARFTRRERESTTYRFRFLDRLGELGVDPDTRRAVLGANPNTTLGEESLDNGWFELRDNTQATDSYTGSETVAAAYAMGQADLPWGLRAMAGLRVEYGEVSVITQRPFAAGNATLESAPSSTDLLPAATLTWALSDDMQLRGGFTQTITRPDFHELSPAQKDPVDGNRPVKGNPELLSGLIRHFDVRWEWYLSPRESVSIAGFFKDFDDPIEATINAGADGTLSFRNSNGATNLGLELEARKQLDFFGEWGDPFFVAGNLALIRSEVDLTGDSVVTSKARPLQGQSPYVLNLQFGWEALDAGHNVTLLYNVFGRRVVEVGSKGLPDVYEEPRHMLDVVAGFNLGDALRLNLRAANLIDHEVRATAGPVVDTRFRAGRSFTGTLVWRL